MESWYRKVTQRTKSPELRLGEISMFLVSGRTENHLYFRAEKLRRIKSRGWDTLGERSSGVIVVQKQHKIKFGNPEDKACDRTRMEPVKQYAAVIIGTRERQRMKGSAPRSSYFLTRRMNEWSFCAAKMPHRKKSRPWGWGDSQRTGVRAYPLFVLAEILMKKLSGIVGKIYE